MVSKDINIIIEYNNSNKSIIPSVNLSQGLSTRSKEDKQ